MGLSITKVDIIALIAVYALIAVILILCLYARKHWKSIDSRKIVHIGIGNFVFIWWAFQNQWVMLAFFTVPFAVLLFLAMFQGNFVSESFLGKLSREGHVTGLFLYVISINILVILCFRGILDQEHWVAASIAIVAMTYGDGFGSVVGRRIGKHKTVNGKSLEGSLGVCIATIVMAFAVFILFKFFVNGLTLDGFTYNYTIETVIAWPVCAVLAGIVTAISETACSGDYDNFINPLLIAGLMVMFGL